MVSFPAVNQRKHQKNREGQTLKTYWLSNWLNPLSILWSGMDWTVLHCVNVMSGLPLVVIRKQVKSSLEE